MVQSFSHNDVIFITKCEREKSCVRQQTAEISKTLVELERKREVPKVRETEEKEGEDGGFVVVTRHEIIHKGTPL